MTLLELCLTFIQESNNKQEHKTTSETFFKRLLYLLETCQFNIQILINNVFIQSLSKLIKKQFLTLIIKLEF